MTDYKTTKPLHDLTKEFEMTEQEQIDELHNILDIILQNQEKIMLELIVLKRNEGGYKCH